MKNVGNFMGKELFVPAANDIILQNETTEALFDALNPNAINGLVPKKNVLLLIDVLCKDVRRDSTLSFADALKEEIVKL